MVSWFQKSNICLYCVYISKDGDFYNMIIKYFCLQDPVCRNASSTGPRMMHFAVNMKVGAVRMVLMMWPREHASRKSSNLGGAP